MRARMANSGPTRLKPGLKPGRSRAEAGLKPNHMIVGMPRSAAQRALFATIGVEMPIADAEAIHARARAAGVAVGAILRGDHAARERERAAAIGRAQRDAQRAVAAELGQARREHGTVVAALRRQLAAAEQAAAGREQAAVERALAAADTPAGRAALHRDAAVHAELERLEVAEIEAQEVRARADRLRAEADATDQQERLARLRSDRDRELAAAERRGEARMAGVAAARITAVQSEADRLRPEIERLEAALAAATDRMRDLEAVVAGVDAQALAERARRDPSDWVAAYAAGFARVAAQPRLERVVAAARGRAASSGAG